MPALCCFPSKCDMRYNMIQSQHPTHWCCRQRTRGPAWSGPDSTSFFLSSSFWILAQNGALFFRRPLARVGPVNQWQTTGFSEGRPRAQERLGEVGFGRRSPRPSYSSECPPVDVRDHGVSNIIRYKPSGKLVGNNRYKPSGKLVGNGLCPSTGWL